MDRNVVGALGVLSALAGAGSAQAATSYADLLRPIPNALAQLRASEPAAPGAHVEEAQFLAPYHHHHHHRYYRRHRRYYHHHHHHHHNSD